MDLDGDDTHEALAILQPKDDNWELQIRDLKELHSASASSSGISRPPFQPPILFSTSQDIQSTQNGIIPLQFQTGQVLLDLSKHQGLSGSTSKARELDTSTTGGDVELNDRNIHFFCGNDWHQASQSCSHPCPGGQATECPDGQRCFAETSCNFHTYKDKDQSSGKSEDAEGLVLTPGGGLPSMVTLWSDGRVSLHSLSSQKNPSDSSSSKRRWNKGPALAIQAMWSTQVLPMVSNPDHIVWTESTLLFLDAYESMAARADHGMIVVSGSFRPKRTDEANEEEKEEDDNNDYSFMVAIHAKDGRVLWDSFTNEDMGEDPLPLPMVRGATSYARRRSRIVDLEAVSAAGGPSLSIQSLPGCHITFRQQLPEILPYSYFSAKDARLVALHLDPSNKKRHHKKNGQDHGGHSHPHTSNGHSKDAVSATSPVDKGSRPGGHLAKKKWHHGFHKHHRGPTRGRPNVLVFHTRGGLQIRSLRNGRPLCHLTVQENKVYSDFNNDGVVDHIETYLDNNKSMAQIPEWIVGMIKKKLFESDEKEYRRTFDKATWESRLCHVSANSGLPHSEELFTTNICGTAHQRLVINTEDIFALPPIVVESLSGRRNTRDTIIALSNGMVHRLQGRSGRKEWTLLGQNHDSFPTWDEEGTETALLTRVYSTMVPAPLRPILVVGGQSAAVVSVQTGHIMAQASFPQIAVERPVLAEVSGDGTADLLVQSKDGIWGFSLQVRQGSPVVLRFAVGFLLFGMLMAILRNRFGSDGVRGKDVRATDR